MSVTELHCTRCNAPVDLSAGALQTCRYCGAALVVPHVEPSLGRATRPRERVVSHFVVVLTVCGPSNFARVEKLLRDRGVKAEEAHAIVRGAPCEVSTWDRMISPTELVHHIEEAGAQAQVEERVTRVAVPPDVRVVIEDAGANKIAVMRALHHHAELGMAESKSLLARVPCVVVDAIEETKGRALHDALVAAGARARIET